MSRRVVPTAAGEVRARASALLETHRLAAIVPHDEGTRLKVVYVFLAGPPDDRVELEVLLDAVAPSVPSLADLSFPAGRFERAMRDGFGVEPVGHPNPRPLSRHGHWPAGYHPLRRDAGPRPPLASDTAPFPFSPVEGTGVYEIPVGPVHAGLIEPGHFRFSVVGETILKMTPRLWFVQRGLERLAEGCTPERLVELAERVSGDSAVAHGVAAALALEEALGIDPGPAVSRVRASLLELERVTRHVAGIGALANDVGLSVAHARALTLVERLSRHGAELTGHRLLRGVARPGTGTLRAPLDGVLYREVAERVDELVGSVLANTVAVDRFGGTAVLCAEEARRLGTLGVVARASGLGVDARVEHPFAPSPPTRVSGGGDVRARFDQRLGEVRDSLAWLERVAAGDEVVGPSPSRSRDGAGLGVVEGWRGAVVHRVTLDGGRVARWSVTDPSFLNWPALALALRDTIVPDFPVANKSFDLSYAGNDL